MADTTLSNLNFGTAATLIYGEEGSASKKYAGLGWYNVKTYGAVGNGSADDTVAIQAAINAITSSRTGQTGLNVGVVFFPPGTYKTTAALVLSNFNGQYSIILSGCGPASTLTGNFNGFIIDEPTVLGDASGMIVERLQILNANTTAKTSGCVRIVGRLGCSVRDCTLVGMTAIDVHNNDFSLSVFNCIIPGPGNIPANSVGIYGQDMTVFATDITGCDKGILLSAGSCRIGQCRFEENNYGILIGQDINAGDSSAGGVEVAGCSFEANGIGIYLFDCTDTLITSCSTLGETSAENLDANSWSINGIKIHAAQNVEISNLNCGGSYTDSCILFDLAPLQLMFKGITTANGGAGPGGSTVTWKYNSINLTGVSFEMCDNPLTGLAVAFGSLTASPRLFQYAVINNCNTTTVGAAANGSGATTVPVQWWGANWRVASSGT